MTEATVGQGQLSSRRPSVRMVPVGSPEGLSASGVWLQARLAPLLAAALAAPALWRPVGWTLAVGLVVALATIADRACDDTGGWGAAAFVVVPLRALARAVAALPAVLGVWLKLLWSLMVGLLLVALVWAAVGAAAGLLRGDSYSLLWGDAKEALSHSWRWGAFLGGWRFLLRGVRGFLGPERPRRGGLAWELVGSLGETGLVVVAVVVALVLLVAARTEATFWPPVDRADGPATAMGLEGRWREATVAAAEAEGRTALGCPVTTALGGYVEARYDPDGRLRLAVVTDGATLDLLGPPGTGLFTAAALLHNRVNPTVEVIKVSVRRGGAFAESVMVDRAVFGQATVRPDTTLAPGWSASPSALLDGIGDARPLDPLLRRC